MANLTKRYLDYDGLVVFLNNLKDYIADRIGEINGSNVNAYDKDEDNPLHTTDPNGYKTIAEQLQALWEAIGVGGDGNLSITEKIENIIGEYVKAINTPTSQTLPLKLKIEEGTEDDKDRFTISLEDNGLADKLDALTANRVSKLEVGDDGGAATLSIDKSTGDVKITINSKALTERVETLESHDGKYSGNSSNDEWNYILSGRSLSDHDGGWKDIKHSLLAISPMGKYSPNHTVLTTYGGLAIGTDVFGGHGIVMGIDGSNKDYLQIGPNHSTGGILIGTERTDIGNSSPTGGILIGTEINIGHNRGPRGINVNSYAINIGAGSRARGINVNSDDISIGSYYSTGGIYIDPYRINIGHYNNSIDIDSDEIIIGDFLKIGSIPSLGTDIKTLQISCGSNASLGSAATKAGMFVNENSVAIGSFDIGLSAMYTKEDLHSTSYRGFISVHSSNDRSHIMALGDPGGFNLISDSKGSLIEHGSSPYAIHMGTDYLAFGGAPENPDNHVSIENQVFGLAVTQGEFPHKTIILGSTPGYNNIIINNDGLSIGNNFISLNAKNNDRHVGGVKFTGDGKMEGSLTGDVTGTASNATNLDNQPASYYAKQSDMTSITERVEAIESDWIKDIAVSVTSKTTTPKYITLEENDNNGDSTITLSEVALCEKFEAVDNNVTVNATNIANETTARENADTALDGRLTDVEGIQSNLASQIQALSLGMKVVGSTSPSTFFKGNTHSVTVTATVQNMPSGFAIEEIKMGNTNAAISDNKGTITESVKLSGTTNSKSWSISARVSGIPFTSSASVSARYPIFYGMDENDNNGLPKSLPATIDYSKMNIGSYGSSSSITGCKLKRDKYRTSARGYSYEKISNSTATPMNFFVLVPSDVSQPTGFTMGGAPFVMDTVKTSTYTIDGVGVTYYIYKSGGIYLNGGSVTLGMS